MRFGFAGLPGDPSAVARPVVRIGLVQSGDFDLTCLVDTGTVANRFGAWIAEEVGIDLSSAPTQRLGIGGVIVTARSATVGLRLEDFEWEAPVSFCSPWPFGYQLLGLEGFFRWFAVTIRAADLALEIDPIG